MGQWKIMFAEQVWDPEFIPPTFYNEPDVIVRACNSCTVQVESETSLGWLDTGISVKKVNYRSGERCYLRELMQKVIEEDSWHLSLASVTTSSHMCAYTLCIYTSLTQPPPSTTKENITREKNLNEKIWRCMIVEIGLTERNIPCYIVCCKESY